MLSIPGVAEGTSGGGSGRASVHALVDAEEGRRRAADDSALVAVPGLADGAGGVGADTVLDDQAESTVAFVVEGIVHVGFLAGRNGVTGGSVGPGPGGTGAGVYGRVPNLSVGAGDLRGNTGGVVPDLTVWALAGLEVGAPDSSGIAGVHNAEVAVPDSGSRAFAAPEVLHPHSGPSALLLDVALPSVGVLDCSGGAAASQGSLVPDLATVAKDAGSPIELVAGQAHTRLKTLVPVLSTSTSRDGQTAVSTPVVVGGADALGIGGIPDSVPRALVGIFA